MSAVDRLQAQAQAEPTPSVAAAGPESGVDGASSSEIAAQVGRRERMRLHFEKQPRVRVRCHQDTFVQVNGYAFNIKGGVSVSVPEQVAELLYDAGRA